MPNPSSHISETKTAHLSPNEPTAISRLGQSPKLNKVMFQILLGLILLGFSVLFIIILIKLPGAF